MDNEIYLQKMVANGVVLTAINPVDSSEVECHIEGSNGDYSLISNNAQGFNLPIRRLFIPGFKQFFILCDGVDDYFEVLDINWK